MVKWLSSEVSNLMSWVRLPLSAPPLTKPMSELRTADNMQTLKASKGLFLVLLMLLASLSGCFGEEDSKDQPTASSVFQIDFSPPEDVTLRTGEWHEFILQGDGRSLSVPTGVMLFVNGSVLPNGYVTVTGDQINGKFLLTPYVEEAKLTIIHPDGTGEALEMPITNGTPIVNGEEWLDKMEFITSVCTDSTECGGYINRWMGTPNPAFERAASFFQGHFEGLGYETHILRVTDHGNPTEPESLNVIAWKEGRDDSCVQGMGAHMDIAPPGGPPGGGTYEGAYDNTGGTVSMMLFAKAFVEIEVQCDTFLALWSSEEEGLRGSSAFANNDCDYCLPTDKELRFYINMDMMGISYPAIKPTGEPYPYHAWSGPDIDPEVQDVEITTVLDHVHRDILGAPMDMRIEGTYGAGCDQHWPEHEDLVMDVHEDTFGRSDHVTFRDLGAQTIFHLGAYDSDYSAYHSPDDTLDNMIEVVGGEDELKKSMEFVMWAAMLEFMIADQTPEVRNVNA